MPTVLLTGACGFCARHLVERLTREGHHQIIGADRRESPPPTLRLHDYLRMDVRDPAQVRAAVRRIKPDLVFHLAGELRAPVEEIYRTNLLGSIYLLEALREHAPAARILLAGSAAEYGQVETADLPVTEEHPCRPLGAYGVSKHAMTLAGCDYARRHRMHVVISRAFNIVGPGVPPTLVVGAIVQRMQQALQPGASPVIQMGNLDSARDFIAVEDAMDAYVRLLHAERWGKAFNICSGEARSIRSIATLLLSYAPRPLQLEVDTTLVQSLEATVISGSWQNAHRAFGFTPATPLEETLRATWAEAMERHP